MTNEKAQWIRQPKDFVLALESGRPVAPGESLRVQVEPNCPARPITFSVPSGIADRFLIVSFQIGRVQMLLGPNGVPASAWSDALCCECSDRKISRMAESRWPLLPAGVPVHVVVTNVSSASSVFRAYLACQDVSKDMGDL